MKEGRRDGFDDLAIYLLCVLFFKPPEQLHQKIKIIAYIALK
jgi:hypothetical protein